MANEYKIKINTKDIERAEKIINNTGGELKRLGEDEVVVKLNYDDSKVNKVIQELYKNTPTVAIQLEYELNKAALEKEKSKLRGMELTFNENAIVKQINILSERYSKMLSNDAPQKDIDELTKKLSDLYATFFTVNDGADNALEKLSKNARELYEDLPELSDGNSLKIVSEKQYKDQLKKVEILKNKRKELIDKGANEDQTYKTKIAMEGILELFSKYANINNDNKLSSFWDIIQKQILEGDENLKSMVKDLGLVTEEAGELKIVSEGMVKSGGLIGDKNVLLATKKGMFSNRINETKELKDKLEEAYEAGVNVSRILDIAYDEASDTFIELQEKANGNILGSVYGQMDEGYVNPDLYKATDEQILKLIQDLVKLHQIGVGVDINPGNISFDENKGFSFFDLDLNPAEYKDTAEFIDDIRKGIIGSIRMFYEDMNDDSGIQAINNFEKKFDHIFDIIKSQMSSEVFSPNEIEKIIDTLRKTGFHLGTSIVDGFRDGIDAHSNSKESERAVDDFSNGVVDQFEKRIPDMENAAKKAGDAVSESFDKALNNKQGQTLKDIENAYDSYTGKIAQKAGNLKQLREQYDRLRLINHDIEVLENPDNYITSSNGKRDFVGTGKKKTGSSLDELKAIKNEIIELNPQLAEVEDNIERIKKSDFEDRFDHTFTDFIDKEIHGVGGIPGEFYEQYRAIIDEYREGKTTAEEATEAARKLRQEIEQGVSSNQNNLLSDTTTPSTIDEITQAEDRMGNEAQEATEQVKQGLVEIQNETEALEREEQQAKETAEAKEEVNKGAPVISQLEKELGVRKEIAQASDSQFEAELKRQSIANQQKAGEESSIEELKQEEKQIEATAEAEQNRQKNSSDFQVKEKVEEETEALKKEEEQINATNKAKDKVSSSPPSSPPPKKPPKKETTGEKKTDGSSDEIDKVKEAIKLYKDLYNAQEKRAKIKEGTNVEQYREYGDIIERTNEKIKQLTLTEEQRNQALENSSKERVAAINAEAEAARKQEETTQKNIKAAEKEQIQATKQATNLMKNGKLMAEYGDKVKDILVKIKAINTSVNPTEAIGELKKLRNELTSISNAATEAGKSGMTMGQILASRFKSLIAYLGTFVQFYDIVRYTRQAISTIAELDTQLVDLRKTTTMTSSELNEFYRNSTELGKQLGVTTNEIISQAAAWSRLGYSSQEAATQMAQMSSKFASISPGMTTDQSTDYLVSTMQAYGIAVDDVERKILDNVNKIGNTFATTNAEIGEMLTRSSAAMKAANNSLEETIALESAAVEITRNAETTGTAFRTVSMRIRGKQLMPPYSESYMLCA